MAYSYECRLRKVILHIISFKTDVAAPTILVLGRLTYLPVRMQKAYTGEGKEPSVDIGQLSNS